MTIDLRYGDAIEQMKFIADESIDAIISDIPYGISFSDWDVKHSNTNTALLGSSPAQQNSKIFKSRGKPKNGWSDKDKQISIEFQIFCESFLKECYRIMKPASPILCFTGRQYQHRFTVAGENSGLILKDVLSWNKKKAPFKAQRIGQVIGKRNSDYSDNRRLGNLAPIVEPIVYMFKPYKIGGTITDCYLKYGTGTFSSEIYKTNLIEESSHISDKLHETQKPLKLMENLIKTFTKEYQTVLDMFGGSMTTGIACINTNRNFIGIENNMDYFNISLKRVEEKRKEKEFNVVTSFRDGM
jgi:site-specific DNA-methyltransferase (adenine-specific)